MQDTKNAIWAASFAIEYHRLRMSLTMSADDMALVLDGDRRQAKAFADESVAAFESLVPTPQPEPERRAPVRGNHLWCHLERAPGTISWYEHLQAWDGYCKAGYSSSSAERIADVGGFEWQEIVKCLGHEPTTWKPRT